MSKLSFFYQKRKDSGIRAGIEVDSELVLHRFVPGDEETDSALLWYIDVRIETPASIAEDPVPARQFFLDNAKQITVAMQQAAGDLRAGLDGDIWPRSCRIAGLPSGSEGEITCSSTVRLSPGELSNVLKDLAAHWSEKIGQLEILESVA